MKKYLCILLLFCFLLTACQIGQTPTALGGQVELPANGIIGADLWKTIKEENAVTVFCGMAQGISYEWTVFGSEIGEPADTDLGLTVVAQDENSLSLRLHSAEDFAFSPLLTVYTAHAWQEPTAVIGELPCEVYVTGSDSSVLNIAVAHTGTITVSQAAAEQPHSAETAPAAPVLSAPVIVAPIQSDSYLTPPASVSAPPSQLSTPVTVSDGTQAQIASSPSEEARQAEPEDQTAPETAYTCTVSIECTSVFQNLEDLEDGKLDALPSDGIILPAAAVTFYEGESVYDVLQRVCRENGIHMEASWTPIYNSAYVEGIYNLYEFDCGEGSGWMYCVNGWYPNYGCSRYILSDGDRVQWRYTCDLGSDIGGSNAMGG